ncbi:MAG: protein kinase, partial [Phycisphaerae bacterium]
GVTVTGELIGSPLYMSPEQIMEGSGRVDHRTDVYSLGATMYEWLTLSPPYPGDTREGVISKIVNSQPAAPRSLNPSVPVDLETICLKAIEADRNRRYQTAAALCKDLMRFLESRPIKARRIGPTVRLRRYIQRHQLASLTMVACSIVALLVSALFLAQREVRSQRREVEAQAVQIAEVKQRSEELLQLVSPLLPPGLEGSLSLVRAARPILEGVFESGAVSGGTADTAPARGADSALTGEPQGIARRAVRDLYNAIAPRYWSGSPMARDCSFAVLGGIQVQEAGAAKARRTVDRCLLADPDHIEARQLHLALCGQMRQYDTMASDAQQLIRQRSTEPTGHLWLGLARLLLDDAQRGLEDFDIAAEMVGHRDVRLVWAKALRGLALILLDQPGNARLELSEALVLAPNLVVALLSRACAGAALGDLPGAVADLDRVIAQEPNNADTIALRGEHSLAMGEFDAAIRDFNEAMRIAGPTARLQMQVLSALYLRQNMSKPRPAEPSPAQAPAVDSPTDESSSRGMLGRPAGLPGFDEPAVHRRASAPRSARAWFPFPLAFLP